MQLRGLFTAGALARRAKGQAASRRRTWSAVLCAVALGAMSLTVCLWGRAVFTPVPAQIDGAGAQFVAVDAAADPPFRIYVYANASSDVVSAAVQRERHWDRLGSRLLVAVLDVLGGRGGPAAAGSVVDFGANLGWFSLLAAARGARVVAIEALADNVRAMRMSLRENAAVAPRVRLVHAALVAGHERDVCLDGVSRPQRNVGNAMLVDGGREGCRTRVAATRLDDVIGGGEAVAFMKADCEGCEAAALHGGRALLSGDGAPCAIYAEWFPRVIRSVDAEGAAHLDGIGALLTGAGYEVFDALQTVTAHRSVASVVLRAADAAGPGDSGALHDYFGRHAHHSMVCLNTAPRCFPPDSERRRELIAALL
jgi:FkbM family methyltransferase